MSDTPPLAPEPLPSSPPPSEPEPEPVVGRLGMAVVVALPLHALALWLLTFAPGPVEAVYGQGVFPLLSALWALLDQTPASPAISLVIGLLAGLVVHARGQAKPVRTFLWRLIVALALLGHLFPICWGLNYWRPSIPQRKGLDLSDPPRAALEQSAGLICAATNRARVEWTELTRAELEERVDAAVRAFLAAEGLDEGLSSLRRPVRRMPAGLFLTGGWTGICLPWTTESWVDPGVDPRVLPVTMAHEKAHQAGFARESDCDLVAFLALVRSEDPQLRYAALFDVSALFGHHSPVGLSAEVLADHGVAAKRVEEVKIEVVQQATRAVYHTYLQVNAVQPGIDDYEWVERLIHAWLVKFPAEKERLQRIAAGS